MVTRNGEVVAEGVDIDFVGVGAVVKSSMNTVLVEIPRIKIPPRPSNRQHRFLIHVRHRVLIRPDLPRDVPPQPRAVLLAQSVPGIAVTVP
jgi:hypothetical protein